MFRVSPYQNSLTCYALTSPSSPTMNQTLALLDLSTIYVDELDYICSLGRDLRVRDIEGQRDVDSEGSYSAGGSKMDGTSFKDLRYFFRRSNLSGSMQTRSVYTSSQIAAIKIITIIPIHNQKRKQTEKKVSTSPTFQFSLSAPSLSLTLLFLSEIDCIIILLLFNYITHSSSVCALRHLIYFKQQQMAKSVHTRDSYEEHSERQVFYYSKFDLFGKEGEEQLLLFSLFTQRVRQELGGDWAAEAAVLYYPYLSSKEIFLNLMELWLKHHPPVNSMRPFQKASTFNSQFVAEFDSLIRGPSGRLSPSATVKPALPSLRAVCLGFYMTANQIWQELFQNTSNNKPNLFSGSFLRGVTSTIEKTFKPLMVVTQKISNVFGRKRIKLNEEGGEMEKEDNQGGEMRFEDCYHEFRRALDIEKKLQRKMGDFDLDDYEVQTLKKQVKKQGFQQSESPLQPSLVSNLYSYVTGFLNRNPSWQVASTFVTQILDLNQAELAEGQKVKVLRPAQDFYRKLVIVWLMCQQSSTAVGFDDYLSVLKGTFMGEQWENRFVHPTRYFFQTMKNNWQQIKSQNPSVLTEKTALSRFISRIKGCVSEDWQDKIAKRR